MVTGMQDFEQCYRAVSSRDARFDGWFFTAVTSTGIYCRPSCPALTPRRENVRFYPTAAAAQQAGFRACKRCRPDATPGSPDWDIRADVVGRAMRLIADGIIEREGVDGLARRLGFSARHIHRQLAAEVGAGPLALARAQRAQNARLLLETTGLSVTEVAFASGFGSQRQFNDTVREVFATTPGELRRRAHSRGVPGAGAVSLRLPYRAPYDAQRLFAFLAARAVPGVAEQTPRGLRRSLALPHGAALIDVEPADGHIKALLQLADLRDLQSAVRRCRAWLDLDADPVAVDRLLGADPGLGPLVRLRPGLRAPGAVDGEETAVLAVLGQQVSVAGARTVAGRLVQRLGKPLNVPSGGVTHLFPSPEAIASADPGDLPMPAARRRCLQELATRLADGDLRIDPGAERDATESKLLQLPGIGAWTAGVIRMRALHDPDVFLSSDLGVRRGLARFVTDPTQADERWRPWRSYAVMHLWTQGV
jgi:AraC family transcriptional regulator of adaptative response / DNA-3-methyladenine glycosylase II